MEDLATQIANRPVLRSRGGYDIYIAPDNASCIVTFDGHPEYPRTGLNRSIDQSIARICFIGQRITPQVTTGEVTLVPNRGFRLYIPFDLDHDGEPHSLRIACGSTSDHFPVLIDHCKSVQEYLNSFPGSGSHRFVCFPYGSAKVEIMKLKILRAGIKILILHPPEGAEEPAAPVEKIEPVRASDMADSGAGSSLKGDPVFLARIHLRNLDLEETRSLLLDFILSQEEIEFIRTFLRNMIRNERNDKDLVAARSELQALDELFRLGQILLHEERNKFDAELDSGIDPRVSGFLMPLVARLRSRADSKDDEILLWEWEYRLGKLASGK